jgi:malonate-semialdehyde dehydrogenase (acetylating)/methylmalonate-semialdehyde dehydrogenase
MSTASLATVPSQSQTVAHWIDGQRVTTDARSIDITNPADGTAIGSLPCADEALVDRAVRSSAEAFKTWSCAGLSRRMPIMQRFRTLLADHAGSMRLPVGVCAGITPFNFPAMVPLWMFPIALACGNTFVLKPSERDPSASLMLAELLDEAGLPPGVFNVVQGDRVAVDALLTHPQVRAISFVGSSPVARHIYSTGAAAGTRVQALGGAKNHMIVLPDADIDLAADAAVSAAFGSAGQRCMAISVAVAVGASADPLVAAITERAARVRVGPSSDSASDMGPVITSDARDRIRSYVDRGEATGAAVAVDGRELVIEGHEHGNFVGPTVLDHVTPEMDVYRDEVFAPAASMLPCS